MQIIHDFIPSLIRPSRRVAVIAILVLLSGAARADDSRPLVVFAAASTTEAIAPIVEAFTADTGVPVVVSYGSSSSLARQIEHGAPADLYLSANMAWLDSLAEKDLIVADSLVVAASNRLVLIAPAEQEVSEATEWERTLFSLLGGDGRLALGDPDHVPAGIYARQALEAAGVWGDLEDRLARTADVRGALALVARGEAPVGLVYASDALISDAVKVLAVLPDSLHDPIVYAAAAVTGGNTGPAEAFLDLLTGPQGAAAFVNAGFWGGP